MARRRLVSNGVAAPVRSVDWVGERSVGSLGWAAWAGVWTAIRAGIGQFHAMSENTAETAAQMSHS